MGTFFFWIIVGAIAGFIAEKVMKADMGIIANIVMGVIGAFVGGFIFSLLPFFDSDGGWIWSIVVATIGAIVVIAAYRAIRGRSVTG